MLRGGAGGAVPQGGLESGIMVQRFAKLHSLQAGHLVNPPHPLLLHCGPLPAGPHFVPLLVAVAGA